jgi:putative endonuclease
MRAAVYILTNKFNGTLYVGVTGDLLRRIWEHRNATRPGFASRYGCYRLVYYEAYENIEAAIAREKAIKGGSRQRKIDLIRGINPGWEDLYPKLLV